MTKLYDKDLTDLAPIEFQFMIWGYCVTDRRDARTVVTRLDEASQMCERQGPVLDLGERYWDYTYDEMRRTRLFDLSELLETPPSWALSGVRLAQQLPK